MVNLGPNRSKGSGFIEVEARKVNEKGRDISSNTVRSKQNERDGQ